MALCLALSGCVVPQEDLKPTDNAGSNSKPYQDVAPRITPTGTPKATATPYIPPVQSQQPGDFDWEKIFEGADWFHWTGITPALGGELPEICLDACKTAKKLGLTVSCDLNFRKKLWSREQANKVMSSLMPYVDVCISNEEDAKDVFGICAKNTDIDSGKLNHEGYISVAEQLTEKFGFKSVAITLRSSLSANDNDWAGMIYTDGKAYFSPSYRIHIVDRVGGGDSFGGGLIYSCLTGKAPQDQINFAVAASCLKHTIEFDYNMVSVGEVENLAKGNATGRIQR